jgi:hypothetical protein
MPRIGPLTGHMQELSRVQTPLRRDADRVQRNGATSFLGDQ